MKEDNGYGSIDNSPSGGNKRRQAYSRRRSSRQIYKTFFDEFHKSRGGCLIVLLGFLSALGLGCVVGVIPQVATQLYAERIFGYDSDNNVKCNSFDANDPSRPKACVLGADYAQTVASYSVAAKHCLALLTNSVAGSYADTHGRRGIQLLSLFIMFVPLLALVLIQVPFPITPIHPNWFFVAECFSGIINFFSIAFMQLSDLMPPRHRAAAYGVYFGGFMGALAIAPFLATVMSHLHISIFGCCVKVAALVIAALFLPETLPKEIMSKADAEASTTTATAEDPSVFSRIIGALVRPVRELSILSRNRSVVLVAVGSFASKMVFSADITLFFYYTERELGVTDKDVARMMFLTGILGLTVQAGLLKYLISLLGERRLLVISFCSGAIHNFIYGVANTKWLIYFGLCLSPLTNINSPLLSSLASRNVSSTEQGRIQGALFSLTSVAEAIGPVFFNFMYRNWYIFGSGTMFIGGAIIFCFGTIAVSMIPPKTGEQQEHDDDEEEDEELTTLT